MDDLTARLMDDKMVTRTETKLVGGSAARRTATLDWMLAASKGDEMDFEMVMPMVASKVAWMAGGMDMVMAAGTANKTVVLMEIWMVANVVEEREYVLDVTWVETRAKVLGAKMVLK